MREYTRADLLALTPDRYLAEGYTDGVGHPRPELRAEYAAAACTQFLAAELSPQELGFTFEAIRLLLPEHDEPDPGERLRATTEEALVTVARAIQQRNNGGLRRWLDDCTARVRTAADLSAFLAHMQALVRQYAVLVAMVPAVPDGASGASPPGSSP